MTGFCRPMAESDFFQKKSSCSCMFICHFRNEKETGAKMSPAIVSGIVNKDAINQ